MVIITQKPLKQFMAAHPDAAANLKQWIEPVLAADWGTLNELKAVYPSASLVANGRVTFNISGNKYRLVAVVIYPIRTLFIRFIGSHSAYDQIDVTTV